MSTKGKKMRKNKRDGIFHITSSSLFFLKVIDWVFYKDMEIRTTKLEFQDVNHRIKNLIAIQNKEV